MENPLTVHYEGRYLKLVERDGWEFATRQHPVVVVLVAWTDQDEVVLVEQYREPVRRKVIELPAGLVGDLADHPNETVLSAGHRELLEETGYRAGRLTEIMRCPTSAGMTDELAVFLRAEDLVREGPGGGDDSEDIRVHRIASKEVDTWLAARAHDGFAIDPKIYTALYWREKPPRIDENCSNEESGR